MLLYYGGLAEPLEQGNRPPADYKVSVTLLWREHFFITKTRASCIATCMNNTDFFLLGDVARILRCQPYQIVYLLTTRQVPEPALRIGNKRVFTLPDIQRVA